VKINGLVHTFKGHRHAAWWHHKSPSPLPGRKIWFYQPHNLLYAPCIILLQSRKCFMDVLKILQNCISFHRQTVYFITKLCYLYIITTSKRGWNYNFGGERLGWIFLIVYGVWLILSSWFCIRHFQENLIFVFTLLRNFRGNVKQ
jgi:hypothetical protein